MVVSVRRPTRLPSTNSSIPAGLRVPTTWCHWSSLNAALEVTVRTSPGYTPNVMRPLIDM